MIHMTLRGGAEYTGRNIDTIIRREWGNTAFLRRNANPNSPQIGEILVPSDYPDQAAHVAGTVLYIEQA